MFVSAVVLGPLLLPGYPLRFDLVSVPGPVLGDDALGLGDRLPRAIPLDAVTALLAFVLPDALVTQVLSLAALGLAGWGAARLTPGALPARLLALVVAIWNPFVLEQLAIGHVPHLLAYGALPWVAIFAHRLARGAPDHRPVVAWAGMTAAAGLGSLTPGGGALCGLAALAAALAGAVGGRPGRVRRALAAPLTVAVLQTPWLVSAMVHPAFAEAPATDPAAGLSAFELRAETGWGRLIDALGLGGMWNAAALPPSRSTVLVGAGVVLLLALAGAGLPAAWRLARAGRRPEVLAVAAVAATGYLVAVLPVLPGGRTVLAALVDAVPGAGLLRDGHRWLAPWALAVAVLAGLAAGSLRRPGRAAGAAVLAGCLLVATMPDLAGGLGGRLAARHYPADWSRVRATLDAAPDSARVLVLPWQPFRRFDWSGEDAVLDPAPRLLPRQVVVSDALTVAGSRLPEEGTGARAIAAALADGRLDDGELRGQAIGWVLVERGTPGEVPELPPSWTTAVSGPDLLLLRAPDPLPAAPGAGTVRAVAVLGSHLVSGAIVLAALAILVLHGVRRRRGAARP